jgi:hypothetical protein
VNELKIEYVDFRELKVPEWKSTHILRPDLLVLSASLSEFGFIEPIHVRRETMEIIDGSERFLLFSNINEMRKKHGNTIPVVFHDIDKPAAMMMHLRMNRGRSSVTAKRMSNIVRKLAGMGLYKFKDFDSLLCMKSDEFELMMDGSLLKSRKISDHTYSRAWVPVEAPPGTVSNDPIIERPPNSDR